MTEPRTNAPLGDLLGRLADHEARASAATAPDVRTEALQMRTEIHRLRTRRVAVVTASAAAAVVIGIVTANAVTPPPTVLPAVPEPSATATASTTPSAPAPSPTPTPTPTATPTLPPPAPTPPPVVETPTPTPPRPEPADVVHGARVWGVYVAVVDTTDSPAAVAAQDRVTALGYEHSVGDVNCDRGAVEALGIADNSMVIRTYFRTREDAALFVDLYGPGTVGIAQVTLGCLD